MSAAASVVLSSGRVISLNLKRRHLSESQRAMVAARLANMPADRPSSNSANLQTSQTQAANTLQVSPRSVASAAKVIESGSPELIAAVESGQIKVSTAATVAESPKDEQAEIMQAAQALDALLAVG